MAKKSKTQRAKASAARQAKKEAKALQSKQASANGVDIEVAVESGKKQKSVKFSKSASDGARKGADASSKKPAKASEKKQAKKPGKLMQFLKDVRLELKRVTWPSREDVGRWSMVVVVALLFFGIYVSVLDNVIITPLLFMFSGLGA